MRQLLIFVLVISSILACSKSSDNFKIKGTATGIADGEIVYLKTLDENGREHSIDEATIHNEKFKMHGTVHEPSIHFISTNSSTGQLIFMLENNAIEIKLNKNNLMFSEVDGSETNKDFALFRAGMDSIRDSSRNVVLAYRKTGLSNKQERDSLHKLLEKSSIGMQDYPLIFVQKYRNSYFSLNLIGLETTKPKVDIEGFFNAFNNLSSELQNTPKGVKIKTKLDSLIINYKKSS